MATTLPIRQCQDMTTVEATSRRTYARGDVLVFHTRLDAVIAKKGAVRTVVRVDENSL